MTAIDRSVVTDVYGDPITQPQESYLTHEKGLASWLLTLDHKRIGILYMITVLAALLLGGMFAILLRTELIAPGMQFGSVLEAREFYNQMFTLHGAVLVFMFIIPAIPAILGNFVLPLMLGAKDVAFPRLNLMSWYCYIGGGAFFVWVLLSGILESAFGINVPGGFGLDTGWTFYSPYSTNTDTAVVAAVTGAFILGFSSILTGVNFIATTHMLRAPGQSWFRLPLFVWGLYATALIQILATPVLAITLLLLAAERILGVGIFNPALGGDPILFQHFFWFYSHPAVYIMVLPAFGVISEVISVFSRKHIFGYKFIAFSSVAIALLGFLVWGHHMFVSGQVAMANAIFSLLTFSVAIPSAIKVFNWVATMYGGNIRLDTPMLYALGFIMLFMIGGLTGLFLGCPGGGYPRSRYVFRRGSLSLCDGGLDVIRIPCGDALLVAEDVRQDVSRSAAAHWRGAGVRGLQRHLLHSVLRRLAGHAPSLCGLSQAVLAIPPDLNDRGVYPGVWPVLGAGRVDSLVDQGQARARQPVGWQLAGLAHAIPGPAAQL